MNEFTIKLKRPIYRFNLKMYSDAPLTSEELQILRGFDYQDLRALSKAVLELGDIAWGTPWSLKGQDFSLDMRLEDLSTVWDEIPEFLRVAAKNQDSSIHFFEQGDEFFLHARAVNDELIELVMESDKDYSSQALFTVRREEFIKEWKRFLKEIIKLMIGLNLIDSNDASLIEYTRNIESL